MPFIALIINLLVELAHLARTFFTDGMHFMAAAVDQERKLALFKEYYNHSRTHASLDGNTPAEISGDRVAQPAPLNSYAWEKHCGGLFQLPVAA